MAVKASASITLATTVDVASCWRYYLLQSSTLSPPTKPTTNPPGGSWTLTEPAYNTESTNTLYFCDLTVFSDSTFSYSDVSVSSSYTAAAEAYNQALTAQDTANDAYSLADTANETADTAIESSEAAQSTANSAVEAATTAQNTANEAKETTDNVNRWFLFNPDGLRSKKQGSKWSTLTDENGFYIDHEDVEGHVGAFHHEMLEIRAIKIGDIIARSGNNGGWVWSDS